MKYNLSILLLFIFSPASHSGVITCSDVYSVGSEAKSSLHLAAQERAQAAAEDLLEKRIVTPFLNVAGQKDTPEAMAALIETYWCESGSTPLHSAYFRFYTNNKSVFK